MQMILSKQEEIIKGYGLANPLVNLKQYRDTLAKFVNMAGFKDESQFLMEITDQQAQQMAQMAQQQSASNPQVQAAEALAQAEVQKAQMKAQADQQKLMLDREQMELKAQKERLELQQKQVQFEKEMALKEIELAIKAESEENKGSLGKTKVIMDALEKINNVNQRVI